MTIDLLFVLVGRDKAHEDRVLFFYVVRDKIFHMEIKKLEPRIKGQDLGYTYFFVCI